MATFTAPQSWPPDPPVFDGLTAESNTLVQFAVGACMLFVQHLVQRLIGFGGLDTGWPLMIGNLVPALEGLLTAFGGMKLGIGSTSPILLLDPGRRRDSPVLDPLVSPGFDLTWKVTEDTHSGFDLGEETVMRIYPIAGCMLLAMLAGAWIIRTRIPVPGVIVRPDAGKSVYGVTSIDFRPRADDGFKAETRNGDSAGKDDARTRRRGDPAGHHYSDPRGDERKEVRPDDSDGDPDDEDPPPPPPGPGTGFHHDDDRTGRNIGWKHFGVNLLLGYFVVMILKGLKKLKMKTEAQRRDPGFVDEQTVGANYGKEWDVLEGTYGSSHNVGWPKTAADVGAAPFSEAVTSFFTRIPSATSYGTRNQTVPTVFSAHNSWQKDNWTGMTNIKKTVEKAWTNFDLTQSMMGIQIYLEDFLGALVLGDFLKIVVMPMIVAVLRHRYGEQDDAEAEADDGPEAHESSSEDNEVSKLVESGQGDLQCRPERREDDEDGFVYLNQRVSAPNEPNQNISEQMNISTAWSSPRRSIERCAAHYSDLAEFIVRYDAYSKFDGNKKDACVDSITEEAGNSEATFVEPASDTSTTFIHDYADDTVTGLVGDGAFLSYGYHAIAQTSFGELDATDGGYDSERTGEGLDTGRGSRLGGGCDDSVQELPNDLSDVESYTTAEGSDVEMEDETEMHDEEPEDKTGGQEAEMESLHELLSDQEDVRYIDGSNTEDEIGDPTRSFPGGFPLPFQPQLWQVPLWGTGSNRWSIFAQFELRERGPLLASEAIDFCLPRSNSSSVENQIGVDSFRTTGEYEGATDYDESERKFVESERRQ